MNLTAEFGNIDIYLFDQLLRGRFPRGAPVLDAGCGSGRNLVYLFRQGYQVFAADADPAAVDRVRRLASTLAPALPPENFRAEPVEAMSFPDAFAACIISSAVLHFARDDAHFIAMLRAMWRVLAPGGLLFCRLASSIGIEHLLRPLAGRRCLLPDSTERYLVDEPLLMAFTAELGATLADPLKTTIVRNQRAMTTWVLRKP